MIRDFFERQLRVTVNPQLISVEHLVNSLGLTLHTNEVSVKNGVVTLTRRPITAQVGVEVGAGVTVRGAVVVQLTQPVPLPLDMTGTPAPSIDPDGSYEFTPQASGGVGPYTFSLSGDLIDGGFVFDASTGRLSRPPD